MRGYKTLLMPAMLALAVHAAIAADDDGTFTINIQGPEESVTSQSTDDENVRSRVQPQNTRQSAGSAQVQRPNQRRTQSVNASSRNNSASQTGQAAGTQGAGTGVPIQGTYDVTSRDTLWSIATRYLPSDRSVNEFQIVASIYRHNPRAFANGNVNRLRAGRINIPVLSEMARESASVGSRLLNQGSLKLPPLAVAANNETLKTPAADRTTASETAQKVIDKANSLPQYQATENVVAEARLNHQQELEQKARDELERATGALTDEKQNTAADNSKSANAEPDKDVKTQTFSDEKGKDDVTAAASSQDGEHDTVAIEPHRRVADGKLDTQALRMMLEGSQKQIDMRMKEINQKLMDTIERMQKANESVTKSTDAAVAALAKQYDGMIAELQQNVTELKGEIAALDRDTTSMREMILANDEKIDAMQVSLADGSKVAGESAKSDFSRAYNYMLAGFGCLALMLLMLYMIFRIKMRNRSRNLETAMSELGETKSQEDDELLSSAVEKESAQSQVLSQEGWKEAVKEVAQSENGNGSLSDEEASKVAKAMLMKAVKAETAQERAETEAVVSKVDRETGFQNKADPSDLNKDPKASGPSGGFHPAEQNEDPDKKDSDLSSQGDMSVRIDDEGTTIFDEMDYDDEKKQLQEQKAQANFESVLNDHVEQGEKKDDAESKPQVEHGRPEDLKDLKFSELEPESDENDLSRYIGSAGSEWFSKVSGDQSSVDEDNSSFKFSSDGDAVSDNKNEADNLSSHDVDELLNSTRNDAYAGTDSGVEHGMSQLELAEAWEKALAEQSASQGYDDQETADNSPKSDASAAAGSDADALSDISLPKKSHQDTVLDTAFADESLTQDDEENVHADSDHEDIQQEGTAYLEDDADVLVEDTDGSQDDSSDAREPSDDAADNADDEIASGEDVLGQSFDLINKEEGNSENTAIDEIESDAEDHEDESVGADHTPYPADDLEENDVIQDVQPGLDSEDLEPSDEAAAIAQSLSQSRDSAEIITFDDEHAPEVSAPEHTGSMADDGSKPEDKSDTIHDGQGDDTEVQYDADSDGQDIDDQDTVGLGETADEISSEEEQPEFTENKDELLDSDKQDPDGNISSHDVTEIKDETPAYGEQGRLNFFKKPQETAQQAAERLFAHDFMSSMFSSENDTVSGSDVSSGSSETAAAADDEHAGNTFKGSLFDGFSAETQMQTEDQMQQDNASSQESAFETDDEVLSSDDESVTDAGEDDEHAADVTHAEDDISDKGTAADAPVFYESGHNEALNKADDLEKAPSDEIAPEDNTEDTLAIEDSVQDSASEEQDSSDSSSAEPSSYDDAQKSDADPLQPSLQNDIAQEPEDVADDSESAVQSDESAAFENEAAVSEDSAEPGNTQTPDDNAADDDIHKRSIDDYESSLTTDHGMSTWGYTDEEEFGVDEDPKIEIRAHEQSSAIADDDNSRANTVKGSDGVPPEDNWNDLDRGSERDKSYTPFTWTVPEDDEFDVTESRFSSDEHKIEDAPGSADRKESSHEPFSSQDGDDRKSEIVNMLSESVPQKELDDLDLHEDLGARELQNMLAEPEGGDDDIRLELMERYLQNGRFDDAQELLHELSRSADFTVMIKAEELIARYKGQK